MARTNKSRSAKTIPVVCSTAAVVAMLAVSGPSHAYTAKTLYSFCKVMSSCKEGSYPDGLVMDPSGNLFGVTVFGGRHYNAGVVFQFVPSTGRYMVLHNFCSKVKASKKHLHCADGREPARVNLVIDVNGNLYGTTAYGGNSKDVGIVFELLRTDSSWREVTLYRFCSQAECLDGDVPLAGLTYAGAASGQLYDGVSPLFGTTVYGGANDHGAVFSLTPQSGSKQWREQVLYSFCSLTNCADGTEPNTPLYIDSKGNVDGTTINGGESNGGVVFQLSPSGSNYTESVPYSFCAQQNCADGEYPEGGVIADSQGNLYGPAGAGGTNNEGVIFELSPAGTQWKLTDLADFDGTNGAAPLGPLIFDTSGNLFGTTNGGGTRQKGTVFAFNGSLQSLYSFCNLCGYGTGVGVIEDNAGNLYGVTRLGGGHNGGSLYELSP